jgi:hypothetical protein
MGLLNTLVITKLSEKRLISIKIDLMVIHLSKPEFHQLYYMSFINIVYFSLLPRAKFGFEMRHQLKYFLFHYLFMGKFGEKTHYFNSEVGNAKLRKLYFLKLLHFHCDSLLINFFRQQFHKQIKINFFIQKWL